MVKLEFFQSISYTNLYPSRWWYQLFSIFASPKIGKDWKKNNFSLTFLKQNMFFMGSKIPSHPPISHLERCPSTENQALAAKPLSGRAETQKRYAEKNKADVWMGRGGWFFEIWKTGLMKVGFFLESHWGESEGSMCCARNDADVWKKWDINLKRLGE